MEVTGLGRDCAELQGLPQGLTLQDCAWTDLILMRSLKCGGVILLGPLITLALSHLRGVTAPIRIKLMPPSMKAQLYLLLFYQVIYIPQRAGISCCMPALFLFRIFLGPTRLVFDGG